MNIGQICEITPDLKTWKGGGDGAERLRGGLVEIVGIDGERKAKYKVRLCAGYEGHWTTQEFHLSESHLSPYATDEMIADAKQSLLVIYGELMQDPTKQKGTT